MPSLLSTHTSSLFLLHPLRFSWPCHDTFYTNRLSMTRTLLRQTTRSSYCPRGSCFSFYVRLVFVRRLDDSLSISADRFLKGWHLLSPHVHPRCLSLLMSDLSYLQHHHRPCSLALIHDGSNDMSIRMVTLNQCFNIQFPHSSIVRKKNANRE